MNANPSLAPVPPLFEPEHRHDHAPDSHGPGGVAAQGRTDAGADRDGIRHAHGHVSGHGHGHEHDHAHGRGSGREAIAPGFSLVRASLVVRLAIAVGLSTGVWAAVLWARLPIEQVRLP